MQVTSGDDALGPEGVEVSLVPVGSTDEDTHIRYVYTTQGGRCVKIHLLVVEKMPSCYPKH